MTQSEAITILKTGANVFLTGEPGSGKTHTINTFIEWLHSAGISPSTTAATGIAATHVSGRTLHSWSGIGIADNLSEADIDRIASKEHVARRIQKAKVLIIEEISMLSAATFEAADAVCREVRRSDQPFGGLIVVLVGDFFQLPPISRGATAQFAYESKTWHALNLFTCYLTEQYRQDDDVFLAVLSAIRSGEIKETYYEKLMTRHKGIAEVPPNVPKLYSHNVDVDRINAVELAKLKTPSKEFIMSSKGKKNLIESLKRGCLSPDTLELKEGAAVMFTKNSPQGKFVNGTLGTIIEFEKGSGSPIVETHEGVRIVVEPMEWQMEEQGKTRASIMQMPLRLSYAMTVHKSQGLSMDEAVMDLSRTFEYGQGYVALSRVRRLSGVHLLGINERALEVHPKIREKDFAFQGASEALQEVFAKKTYLEIEEMQKHFVKAMSGAWPSEISKKRIANTRDKMRAQISKGLPVRLAETLQAVSEAKSLKDVAKVRGLTVSTIVKHLEELSELGKLLRIDFVHLLPKDSDLDEIHEALREEKSNKLSPVFHALNARYSFEIIRLVRLAKQ